MIDVPRAGQTSSVSHTLPVPNGTWSFTVRRLLARGALPYVSGRACPLPVSNRPAASGRGSQTTSGPEPDCRIALIDSEDVAFRDPRRLHTTPSWVRLSWPQQFAAQTLHALDCLVDGVDQDVVNPTPWTRDWAVHQPAGLCRDLRVGRSGHRYSL